MNATTLAVLLPLAGALLASLVPDQGFRRVSRISLAAVAAAASFIAQPHLDGLARIFASIVALLGAIATAYSAGAFGPGWQSVDVAWAKKASYFNLLGLFWSAMTLVAFSDNFVALWIGIAITTLATTFLVGFAGDAASLEAAWKYLVLCSLGVSLSLFGMVLLGRAAIQAGVVPDLALDWSAIQAHGRSMDMSLTRLALAVSVVGFATKAGLAPMHAWLPDAHSKAPPPVSALLSGVLVSCALYAVMRLESIAASTGSLDLIRMLLLGFGALSTIVAGSLMLAQRDLKRLLAYSTVEHVGIVALALGFGGPLGYLAAIIHVVNHAFAKSAAFFAAGAVQESWGTTKLAALTGLWRSRDGRAMMYAVAALSGVPPFGLFISEILVVFAGVLAHQWIALGVGVVGIALAFGALARVAINAGSGSAPNIVRNVASRAPFLVGASIALTLWLLAGASIMPWTVANGILKAASLVLGGAS
jgi:hydrogenase-4 component F